MPYDNSSSSQLSSILTGFGLIGGLIALVTIVFAILIWWRIFSKAGYNGAMSLLMFVPIANLIVLLILAFGEWPIYKELNQIRHILSTHPIHNIAVNRTILQPLLRR